MELRVNGKLDVILYRKYLASLGWDKIGDNEIVLFSSYSDFDIPVGYVFNQVTDTNGNVLCAQKIIILKGVTQQFWKEFDSVPKGWKTICRFYIEGGVPKELLLLPVIKSWFDSDEWVYININGGI